ncbi:NUDIX hydrolase [Planctomycetota bacterium]|nr:NUDIX hydrolase [bacterium]MDB4780287.1 NUDIX hydrolase [Planctomycetota bacterium]MDC3307255.1 NUDIX hydrolase [bacterium]
MHDADIRSEDAQFLAGYDASEFERPSVAVDVALLTVHEGGLRVLLVERVEPPQRGAWALPGGFVGMNESLDDAAARVLRDKGGLEGIFLEQLYSFGSLGRDPRTRVISVAYVALVDHARLEATGRPLAELQVPWEGEEGGPVEVEGMDLAFDHAEILGAAVKRLRGKLDYAALGFQLLPDRFTLRDLQTVHETILGRELNKDSFRRRMLATGLIEPTGEREQNVLHRPAELYRIHQASAV